MSPRLPLSLRPPALLVAAVLWGVCAGALAGRPMDTDDAGTNAFGECQLESWSAHGKDLHDAHLSPACGVGGGLELGGEWAWSHPQGSGPQSRAVGAKWAPEWLSWQAWRFGLKWSGSQARDPHDDSPAWHWQGSGWNALASVPLSPAWTIHTNLGQQYGRAPAQTANTYALALAWTPADDWLLFAEVLGDHRSPANQSVGLRYWLIPDKLGLDLTHSRTNATSGSHRTGVGLGWYGISF